MDRTGLPQEEQEALRITRVEERAAARQERLRVVRETRNRIAVESPGGFILNFDPLRTPYDLGELHHECEFCQALYFIDERVLPYKQFTACCVRRDS